MIRIGGKNWRTVQEATEWLMGAYQALVKGNLVAEINNLPVVDTEEQLPDTGTTTSAYLVGTQKPYHLYVVANNEWLDLGEYPVEGPQGEQGLQGLPPEHQWIGTELQFKQPNGQWGTPVELKGMIGDFASIGTQTPVYEGRLDEPYVNMTNGNVYKYNGVNWVFLGSLRGPQGPKGETGNTGVAGPQGIQGSTGIQGQQGTKGPQGTQGVQGIQGLKGDKGEDGKSFEITGTTDNVNGLPTPSQSNLGMAWTVGAVKPYDIYLCVYNGSAYIWQNQGKLEGPQGEQGPQGVQGEQGPQGPQGEQGPIGSTGAQGVQGIQGPQGEQGPVGPSPSIQDIVNVLYPIGSLYLTTRSQNPSTYLGGSWESWGNGRVPLALGNNGETNYTTVEQTGGSEYSVATHTHTQNSHSHTTNTTSKVLTGHIDVEIDANGASGTLGDGIVSRGTKRKTSGTGGTINIGAPYIDATHTHGTDTQTPTINDAGTFRGNLPPFITCYMWKRTS